jgi:hypothetical protein
MHLILSPQHLLKRIVKRSLAAVFALGAIYSISGCGFPMARRQVDEVYAIGWDHDQRPVALAQETTFYKDYVLLSPDGGMETRHTLSHGRLVLLSGNRRIRVGRSVLPHGDNALYLLQARAVRGGTSFMALIGVPDKTMIFQDEFGLLIDSVGGVNTFYAAERHTRYEISPDGRALYRTWSTPDDHKYMFEAVDVATGEAQLADYPLLEGVLNPRTRSEVWDWGPCQSKNHKKIMSVSPRGDLIAGGCADDNSCLIWICDSSLHSRQVAVLPSFVPPPTKGLDELERRYLYGRLSLAWSPDQTRLYFCQMPGADGYLIDIATGEVISHHPGLMAASWSPDGLLTAGVADNKLTVWRPGESQAP